MSNQGWISLHRKIEDNPIFQNEKALKIWIWVLIRANHTETDILLGRNLIHLKVGQFIFGSDTACERLKMSKSTIHFWLNFLKLERYIERRVTNKYSIITVLNYSRYQTVERQVEYRRNAKRILTVQQNETDNKENTVNTDNTDNKIMNGQKKYTSIKDIDNSVVEEISLKYKVPAAFVKSKLDDMANWLGSTGKVYRDYRLALMNWVKTDALKIIQKQRQNVNNYKPTEIKV